MASGDFNTRIRPVLVRACGVVDDEWRFTGRMVVGTMAGTQIDLVR